MPIHQLKLALREEIASSTYLFGFEKPTNFNFIPGQYGGFTLINPTETDAAGITRRFSIASTPEDSVIYIAMRIQQSAYKRVLVTLPLGSLVKFAGPTGNFILHEDKTIPAVLIAGGIGITPFHSMIKHETTIKSGRSITLFYGNQSMPDTAFMSELSQIAIANPPFHYIPTFLNPEPSWAGETGYISYDMIKRHIPDLAAPIYYICGSAAMVNALHETLRELDIPEERIKIEDFPGY